VTIEIQYRDANVGGDFTAVSRTYSTATLDQIGFTERITLSTPIRPEVRIRRLGAKSTQTDTQDDVQWYGLRARLETRSSYPNWTTIGIHIRGGGRISESSEDQINLIATRILPTLQPDGTWGAATATRDISAAVRYIASTIGYTDDNLDTAELLRLQQIWTARGETLDYVFDETTVKDAIVTCFQSGMSDMTVSDGKIRPVRDGLRTVFQHAYSQQNTIGGGFTRTFTTPRPDDNDGVEVQFVDAHDSWVQKTIVAKLPDSPGIKLDRLTLNGVTDQTRAWRIGMREARASRYTRWSYSFDTEMDALCSEYGDYISLVADVPGFGQSAILTAIEGDATLATLTLSEPLTWDGTSTYVLALRSASGVLVGPFTATYGGAPNVVSIAGLQASQWPEITLGQEPPHVYFGTTERWTYPALVRSVSPKSATSVSVDAVNYHPAVYADDDNAPPAQ
jgi:hypothetical protein